MKKRGLGRGLGELLSNNHIEAAAVPSSGEQLQTLPVHQIERGKYQPRHVFAEEALKELADSIRSQGVIQPIVVRELGPNQYEIIAGERRWRAAQLAGLDVIPSVVRKLDDQSALAISLIENIQREQLNPIEEARAIERLIEEFELTQDEAAQALGRSRVAVSHFLRLLNLHSDVIKLLESGGLEMGHAKVILGLKQKAEQREAANIVVQKGLTVRETESLVKHMRRESDSEEEKSRKKPIDPDITRLEKSLSEKLGAKVAIRHKATGRGKLIIGYHNLEQLEGILSHLK